METADVQPHMESIRLYGSPAYIAIATVVYSAAFFLAASVLAEGAVAPRTPVLFVGMQHFVSRANVYNVSVGNVRTKKRQVEIVSISRGPSPAFVRRSWW